ncbi:AGE family epimerase/isomerase [candidate division KSB1 bacterium]|nr:AGE family epimerase/isomerase [candidate division KSB1 bacterium]
MKLLTILLVIILVACSPKIDPQRLALADEIERTFVEEILHAWYPRAIDLEYGGFLSQLDYRWQPGGNQDKMIVTQARHVWTASKAAQLYADDPRYRSAAASGFQFLREKMWDQEFGGFYQFRAQDGGEPDNPNLDYKTSYGNAFGLYAVSAYYHLTHDPAALEFAREIFAWFEQHAYDEEYGGYFQNFNRQNEIASASASSGFTAGRSKDQNTSIHVLEALTELYKVWPDPTVRDRLGELLEIIRDRITRDLGSLTLFLERDWTPISLQDSSESYIRQNIHRDHVSSGHDVETAFLLLEASHALGLENDERTLTVAKKMVDHALAQAWDEEYGGIFDVSFYFKGDKRATIMNEDKSWWAQVEALNAFLMMSLLYPDQPIYYERFTQQWTFIDTYVIDHTYGGVYSESIGHDRKMGSKANVWKGPYHTSRALMNCVRMLREHEWRFDEHNFFCWILSSVFGHIFY